MGRVAQIQGYIRDGGYEIHPFIISPNLQMDYECTTDTSVLDWKLRLFRDSGNGSSPDLGLRKK